MMPDDEVRQALQTIRERGTPLLSWSRNLTLNLTLTLTLTLILILTLIVGTPLLSWSENQRLLIVADAALRRR